jgi:hypothetical protein
MLLMTWSFLKQIMELRHSQGVYQPPSLIIPMENKPAYTAAS